MSAITRNRELSQFGSFLNIDDATQNIGITTSTSQFIGIGSLTPTAKVDIIGNVKISGVVTATTFSGNLVGSSSVSAGLSSTANVNTSGIITASSYYINDVPLINAAFQTWFTTGVGNTTYLLTGNVGIGTSRPTEKLSVVGNVSASQNITASRFISTTTTSSPLQVSSSSLVTNLNADFLRGKLLGGTSTGDIVSIDATQTLSNKTLSSPTLTTPTVESGGINFSGTTGTTSLRPNANASGTLTLPAPTATDILVARNTADTLTNKTIAAASNTISGLTNSNLSGSAGITNENLANSTISGVSLGSSLNSLTVGSYLSLNSGTSYNGSAARTISVNASSSNADPTNFPIVSRDASGDFSAGTITATSFIGNLSGNVTGNATSADTVDTTATSTSGTYYLTFVDNSSTTSGETIRVGSGITYNPSTNRLTTGTFVGNVTGNVTGNATSADTVDTTATSTAGTYYLTFVDNSSTTSGETIRVGSGITYNPSTNRLTTGTFVGNLSGNATSADTVDTTATSTAGTYYLTFVDSSSSSSGETIRVHSGITYDPSDGTLTTTDINSTSDINLKKNINQIENALNKVQELNGVSFEWKSNDTKSIGVIAQEVEKIFPELVKEGEDRKTVNYNGLVGVLIEAIKELSAEVEELKKKVS